jgi:hypothetical protein
LSAQEALEACEAEFMQGVETAQSHNPTRDAGVVAPEPEPPTAPAAPPELNASDVLAEISRMLDEKKEQE